MDFDDQLNEVEGLILKGQMNTAVELVHKIHGGAKIPVHKLERFGNLANRCGEFNTCLTALHKYVSFNVEVDFDRFAIIKEYATALLFLGCRKRANHLISQCVEMGHQDSLFILGLSCLKSWDFEASMVHLRDYLKLTHLSDYQKRIGQLNLAFAENCAGNHQVAKELLLEITKSKEAKEVNRLMVNSKQVLLEVEYGLQNWSSFSKLLSDIEEFKAQLNGEEVASYQRWRHIERFLQDKNQEQLVKSLNQLFLKCSKERHYELARSCDFYLGKYTGNRDIILKTYFGSPYDRFREFIKAFPFTPPESTYMRDLSPSAVSEKDVINLKTGECNGRTLFDVDSTLFKAFQGLLKDFYRPVSCYEMFEEVFPDEFFNPSSSLTKLKSTIYRLNNFLESQNIGMTVFSRKMNYQFKIEQGLMVECYESYPKDEVDALWEKLAKESERVFKSKDFYSRFNLNEKKGQKLLRQFIEDGKLEKIGRGSNTKYRITEAA